MHLHHDLERSDEIAQHALQLRQEALEMSRNRIAGNLGMACGPCSLDKQSSDTAATLLQGRIDWVPGTDEGPGWHLSLTGRLLDTKHPAR